MASRRSDSDTDTETESRSLGAARWTVGIRIAAAAGAAIAVFAAILSGTAAAAGRRAPRSVLRAVTSGADADPAPVAIGERLFLETRFAQYFAAGSSDVNAPLPAGDPTMAVFRTSLGPIAAPFAGLSMNCRNCHLVDDTAGAGTRTYDDYSRRSRIPAREDGATETPRNSPTLVDALRPRSGPVLLHFDGEFASIEDLVRATLTGRNLGWMPLEGAAAAAHIARVVREDDGRGDLASQYGGAYRTILGGTDPSIPPELVLPEPYRVDVLHSSDDQVVDAVVRLISAYVASLAFQRDDDGSFSGSPYDAFLVKNGLPRAPAEGESDLDYSRRLRATLNALTAPRFVGPEDGRFGEHDQEFVFGPDELKGAKIFFREALPGTLAGDPRYLSTRTGNCIACHPAPGFTDFSFHNTGATQDEYDEAHGDGAFDALFIPDVAYRGAHPDEFLPPTAAHPNASGRFRGGETDLGLWNVFANPDFPIPQAAIRTLIDPDGTLTDDAALRRAIGAFKTPGLRDLGQSGPYLHTGRKREIEEVLEFYVDAARRARQGRLRNAAPQLSGMFLSDGDLEPLAAFLRALNEDYN